jgi:hypothetical protein
MPVYHTCLTRRKCPPTVSVPGGHDRFRVMLTVGVTGVPVMLTGMMTAVDVEAPSAGVVPGFEAVFVDADGVECRVGWERLARVPLEWGRPVAAIDVGTRTICARSVAARRSTPRW